MSDPKTKTCPHGEQFVRCVSCDLDEAEAEISRLTRELDEAKRENERLRSLAVGMFFAGDRLDEMTSKEVTALGLNARRLNGHGHDCPKAEHLGDGYLHGKNDDGPYDVDGVTYCGRCHGWLGPNKFFGPLPAAPNEAGK